MYISVCLYMPVFLPLSYLLHLQARIKHHQLGTDGDEVIRLVELEEFDEDLSLVLLCVGKRKGDDDKLTHGCG